MYFAGGEGRCRHTLKTSRSYTRYDRPILSLQLYLFAVLSDYFTVTVHFVETEPEVIVITAVPFLSPLIFPFAVTVATFLLEDLKVSFSSLFAGAVFAFRVYVFPFFSVISDFTPLIAVVFVFGTVTVTVYFFFPAFTVILAFPAFFAVITPFDVTVATFLLEELKVSLS